MDPSAGHTFKEIDARHGLAKGAAFRAFKRARGALEEGRDFEVLVAGRDGAAIEALRAAGRIYPASVNVVVLGPEALRAVEDVLAPGGG